MDNPYRDLAFAMAWAAAMGLPLGVLAVQVVVVRRGRISRRSCLALAAGAAGALLLGAWFILIPSLGTLVLMIVAPAFPLGAATMALIDLAILVVLDLRGRQTLRMPPWARWPAVVGIGLGLVGVGLGVRGVWSANRTLIDESQGLPALGLVLAMTVAAALADLALRVGLPEVDRQGRRLR